MISRASMSCRLLQGIADVGIPAWRVHAVEASARRALSAYYEYSC